jgi:plasmid stabilization system protein ParE
VRSIRHHEAAREELLHEVRYHAAISARLAERFDRAVQAAEVSAAETPDLGSPHSHCTRRVLLRRFKFLLVCVASGEQIVVIALAAFGRKPGYWKTRLGGV